MVHIFTDFTHKQWPLVFAIFAIFAIFVQPFSKTFYHVSVFWCFISVIYHDNKSKCLPKLKILFIVYKTK